MQKFSQKLMEKVVRAVMKAGWVIGRIDVAPDGSVSLFAGGAASQENVVEDELEAFRGANGYG
jgi:hypothetical protein